MSVNPAREEKYYYWICKILDAIVHICLLILSMLRLLHPKHKDAKIFGNHLSPVMLVLIG